MPPPSPSLRWQKLEEVEKHESLSAHPNCLQFFDAWEERDHLYIQAELCEMRSGARLCVPVYVDNYRFMIAKLLPQSVRVC